MANDVGDSTKTADGDTGTSAVRYARGMRRTNFEIEFPPVSGGLSRSMRIRDNPISRLTTLRCDEPSNEMAAPALRIHALVHSSNLTLRRAE